MRTTIALLLIRLSLALAALPLVANSCAPRPFLPESLRQERDNYTATVVAAQDDNLKTQAEHELQALRRQ